MKTTDFEAGLRADGYLDIESKRMEADCDNAEHSHPFDVRALVLDGQISLTVAGVTRTYAQGEVFTMAADCRHAEAVGTAGVSYLVGRRRATT